MKKLAFLFLFFLMANHARAQSLYTGNLKASTSDCVTAPCVTAPVEATYGGATFTLNGTWSATVQFEASGDGGVTWVALNATPSNSSTAASSSTSSGAWQANVSAYTIVRIRVSAYTSGTVVATINFSTASARGGSGSGSGSIGGSIASTQVAFGTGVNTIGGDSQFTWGSTNHSASIGSTLPTPPSYPALTDYGDGLVVQRQNDTSGGKYQFPFIAYGYGTSVAASGGLVQSYSIGVNPSDGLQTAAASLPGNGNTLGFTGDYPPVVGLLSYATLNGLGTVTTSAGVDSYSENLSTGTITTGAGYYAQPNVNMGGGTLTNSVGYYAAAQTAGTNNYGMYFADFGSGSNTYGIFQAGSSTSNVLINLALTKCTSGCILVAALTTTAATTDNVTITGMTSSGHCSISATNVAAATAIAGTYISAKTTNQITVTHAVTSNMNYDILCTLY